MGLRVLAVAGGLLLVLLAAVYAMLAASLPRRSGEAPLPGLSSPLAVTLDARAIATVRGESFLDVLRGEGFLHAQERFFQMDLLRRSSAGELAELFGERALEADRAQRPFGYREHARALRAALPAEQVAWLDAYTDGVNAGLADLGARPPEYWLAGAAPRPWLPEDSLLVVLTFYTMLSNNESYERPQGVMHAVLPPALYEFLTPSTSRFDRPVLGSTPNDPTGGYVPLPIPGADVVDLRQRRAPPRDAVPRVEPPLLGPASNNWAVDATRGAGGRALVANDPHLSLRLPNIFYRVELEWPERALRGVSIPGLPGVLIGASNDVAWGATVSNADQSDWVVVEVDPEDPNRYLTPDGSEAVHDAQRRDRRRGRRARAHRDARDALGARRRRGLARPAARAARDVARAAGPRSRHRGARGGHGRRERERHPRALGRAVAELGARRSRRRDRAGSSTARCRGASASTARGPSRSPTAAARGKAGARRRARSAAATARSTRPTTARCRQAKPTPSAACGCGRCARSASTSCSPSSARSTSATSSRCSSTRAPKATSRSARRSSTSSRATSASLHLQRARALAEAWNGRADVDQAAFRMLHAYYRALLERTLEPLLAPAIEADPQVRLSLAARRRGAAAAARRAARASADERARRLALVPAASAARSARRDRARRRSSTPSGARSTSSTSSIRSRAASGRSGRRLRLPPAPLPGSMISLRVAAPSYGAVLRMAVAPGAPENGVLELAGGQSGHFLSPQFRDQQRDWVDGAPTPFLAGEPVARFELTP